MAKSSAAAASQSVAASLAQLGAAASTSVVLHAAFGAAALALHQASSGAPSRAPAPAGHLGTRAMLTVTATVCAAALAWRRGRWARSSGGASTSGSAWQWHAAVLLGALCAGLAAVACLNWPAALAAAVLMGPGACGASPRCWAALVPAMVACGVGAVAGGWTWVGGVLDWQSEVSAIMRTTAYWVAWLVCLPSWAHALCVVLHG